MAIGATKLNFEDGQGARNITPLSTAPVFSSSTSYVVGDLVFYDDDLYKCTTAHSGVWNASHFTAVTVSGELQAKEAEIADVKSDLSKIKPLSDEAKEALLACFRNVAWINDQGQTYYDALEEALSEESGKTLLSITAVFNQGQNIIYTDDSLDTLKQYLTVTAHYDDNTDAVVTTYTLRGNLSLGENTVTVVYGEKTTTFSVNVTGEKIDFSNVGKSDGSIVRNGSTATYNRWQTYDDMPIGTAKKIKYGDIYCFDSGTVYIYGISFWTESDTFISGIGNEEADESIKPVESGSNYRIYGIANIPSNAHHYKVSYFTGTSSITALEPDIHLIY